MSIEMERLRLHDAHWNEKEQTYKKTIRELHSRVNKYNIYSCQLLAVYYTLSQFYFSIG